MKEGLIILLLINSYISFAQTEENEDKLILEFGYSPLYDVLETGLYNSTNIIYCGAKILLNKSENKEKLMRVGYLRNFDGTRQFGKFTGYQKNVFNIGFERANVSKNRFHPFIGFDATAEYVLDTYGEKKDFYTEYFYEKKGYILGVYFAGGFRYQIVRFLHFSGELSIGGIAAKVNKVLIIKNENFNSNKFEVGLSSHRPFVFSISFIL